MYTPVKDGDKTTVKMVEDAVVYIQNGRIVFVGEKREFESNKVTKLQSFPPESPPQSRGRDWIPAFAGMTRKRAKRPPLCPPLLA